MDLEVPADCSYVFDLVSPYPRRRERALERHAGYVTALRATYPVHNQIRQRAGQRMPPQDAAARAALNQFFATQREALDHTVHGLAAMFLDVRWRGGPGDRERLAPYAVLFLQWETSFPEQWRHAGPYSPWWIKKKVLRSFAQDGVPEQHRGELVSLLITAVHREHRCEDHGYAALARQLDGPDLTTALARAANAADPIPRLRAQYVQWAADHADIPVTLAGWRRWLAQDR